MPDTIIQVHPDRFNPTGRRHVQPIGVVVHTTESGENQAGIEAFLTKPGERQTSSGRPFGASYDFVAHADGSLGICDLGPTGSPYAAPPLNQSFYHIVIPGRASQDRSLWLDEFSRGCIRAVARLIAEFCREFGIPAQRLTPDTLKEGLGGYCGHGDVSKAFRQTDHTDPGPEFPWDILADDIAHLTAIQAASTHDEGPLIPMRLVRLHGWNETRLVAPGYCLAPAPGGPGLQGLVNGFFILGPDGQLVTDGRPWNEAITVLSDRATWDLLTSGTPTWERSGEPDPVL